MEETRSNKTTDWTGAIPTLTVNKAAFVLGVATKKTETTINC